MTPNPVDFNKDELEAPQWLNAEFLTKVLCQSEQDVQLQVISFKLTPATVKGDHYASVMFRATVDYQHHGTKKTKSLIIKTMPEIEGFKKELLNESHIFETEIGMYTDVIPKFEKILRAVGDETVLGAPCLYYSLEPKKLIVFEDLVTHDYNVLRDRQVNLEEAKVAYSKLAKWHAISHKLLLEDPAYFDKYRYGFLTMDNMVENEFMTGGVGLFVELLDSVPTLRQYKPFFTDLQATIIDKCKVSYAEYRINPQEHSHYVLCHGDFHSKNIMLKNNNQTGALEDVMLLDFQLSFIGPFTYDVIYSFFMMLDKNLRTNHMDEVIYFYFSTFLETLTKIGFKGRLPKLVEFREQLMNHKHWELFLLATFLPMWYAFREGSVDPDQMLESADCRKRLYQNKDYIDELHSILPKYLHLGYFEN